MLVAQQRGMTAEPTSSLAVPPTPRDPSYAAGEPADARSSSSARRGGAWRRSGAGKRYVRKHRFARTLPWLAALLLGTSAQLVFYLHDHDAGEPARVDDAQTRAPISETEAAMRASDELDLQVERRALRAEFRRLRSESRRARAESRRARAESRRERHAARAPRPVEGACEHERAATGVAAALHEYSTVDRALVESAGVGGLRMIPMLRDGVVEGYKLYGIRGGSVPKLAGFRNGDLVTAINGRSLAEGGYMHHFDALPQTMPDRVSFSVRRRGQSILKIVELR
jgi:hypothetical protein